MFGPLICCASRQRHRSKIIFLQKTATGQLCFTVFLTEIYSKGIRFPSIQINQVYRNIKKSVSPPGCPHSTLSVRFDYTCGIAENMLLCFLAVMHVLMRFERYVLICVADYRETGCPAPPGNNFCFSRATLICFLLS